MVVKPLDYIIYVPVYTLTENVDRQCSTGLIFLMFADPTPLDTSEPALNGGP